VRVTREIKVFMDQWGGSGKERKEREKKETCSAVYIHDVNCF